MRTAILPLFLVAPLCAQGAVSPEHFTIAEGNTSGSDGIGITTTPSRFLQVCQDMQGRPLTIARVAFRRDGNQVNYSPEPAWGMLCNIHVSTAATTAAAPNATFDANHGANRATVATFANVQFPATDAGPMVRPWAFVVPFGVPFAHSGQGPLAIEFSISSRTNAGGVAFDRANGAGTNPQPYAQSVGTGCRYTANVQPLALSGYAQTNWANGSMTMSLSASSAKPNSTVFLTLGASANSLGAIPLPFTLPGTQSAPSGACTLYNDILITVPMLANAQGTASINLGLGVNPGYNGLDIFTQLISPDPAANGWGLVLSNTYQFHAVAPYGNVPIGDVYSNSTVGPTGTARPNAGYVLRFD